MTPRPRPAFRAVGAGGLDAGAAGLGPTAGGLGPAPAPPTILPGATADGARNMALDEAMMELAREGRTLVRFYGWDPACLSLGRNQPAPGRLLGRGRSELVVGVDVVRRPTGGRSVFHGPEVTYAFACPDRVWGGPRSAFARIHRAIAEGLASLGIPLDPAAGAGGGPASHMDGGPAVSCFRDAAPGEITARGRKLVGSAQRRRRGALLQHGSILLENRQALGEPEWPSGDAPLPGAGIGLAELADPPPDPEQVVRALVAGFRAVFAQEDGGAAATADPAGPALLDRLERASLRLEPRYRSPERFWRARAAR